jgi:hypothetical protein
MANIAQDATASLDGSTGMFAPQVTGNLYAGEVLNACAPCYIKASDGKVYMSNGTAANEAAKFDGFAPRKYQIGEPVALYGVGARLKYAAGTLVIGTDYYVGTVAGQLSDVATTGGVRAIARAITTSDIRVTKNTDAA